jgi:hypothetical protein
MQMYRRAFLFASATAAFGLAGTPSPGFAQRPAPDFAFTSPTNGQGFAAGATVTAKGTAPQKKGTKITIKLYPPMSTNMIAQDPIWTDRVSVQADGTWTSGDCKLPKIPGTYRFEAVPTNNAIQGYKASVPIVIR